MKWGLMQSERQIRTVSVIFFSPIFERWECIASPNAVDFRLVHKLKIQAVFLIM